MLWYAGMFSSEVLTLCFKFLTRNNIRLFKKQKLKKKKSKAACVTSVFSCDWNLNLDEKWNNTSSIVCAFACSKHISLSVFVYFEDGKWVTCLSYPFSGSHASAPRNWFAWELLRLKTYKGSSGRWLLSKDARSGTDAAMPQPETHTPVLVPAWRYANHTIVQLVQVKEGFSAWL